MDETLKSNVTSSKSWMRFVFMVIVAICLQVAYFVMWVLVILQFLFSLVKGEDNAHLREFGSSLAKYIFQALDFLTYNTEEKPFPFADWPAPNIVATEPSQVADIDATDDVTTHHAEESGAVTGDAELNDVDEHEQPVVMQSEDSAEQSESEKR